MKKQNSQKAEDPKTGTGKAELIPKGRPSSYQPAYADRVMSAMQSGQVTIAMLCRDLGISRPTFYRYLDDHPEFKEAYENGKEHAEAWWDEVGIQGMLSKKLDSTIYCAFRNNISGWRRSGDSGQEPVGKTVNIQNLNILNNMKQLSTEELEAEIQKKLEKIELAQLENKEEPEVEKTLDNTEEV